MTAKQTKKEAMEESIDYNDIVECETALCFRLDYDDTMDLKERKCVLKTWKKINALLDEMDNLPTEH